MVLLYALPAIVSGLFHRDPLLFPQWRGKKYDRHWDWKETNEINQYTEAMSHFTMCSHTFTSSLWIFMKVNIRLYDVYSRRWELLWTKLSPFISPWEESICRLGDSPPSTALSLIEWLRVSVGKLSIRRSYLEWEYFDSGAVYRFRNIWTANDIFPDERRVDERCLNLTWLSMLLQERYFHTK